MHVAINAHLLSNAAGYRQSGISRYIANLIPALARVATGVTRWTIFAPPQTDIPAGFPEFAPVTVVNSFLPTSKPTVRIFWEQLVGPLAIARFQPDVMLCPLNVVPLMARCPTVVTVHDLAFLRVMTHRISRRSYLSTMTRLSVGRSAHAIAVSEFTRNEMIELLGTNPAKITTVMNGCDSQFSPIAPAAIAEWRTRQDLPPRFLLFVGTLEPRKNLVGLIRAYAEFRKTHDVPLVVVGAPGWRYAPIYEVVQSLGLESKVRFEGFVSNADLPFFYAAATAFIYPSLYEGFGLPPLEAMAMGTPVVTSNCSSMPEVVGDAALLVSPTSKEDLVNAMVRIFSDDRTRQRLAAAGPERAKGFAWDTAAGQVMGVLQSVVRGTQVTPPAVEFSTR